MHNDNSSNDFNLNNVDTNNNQSNQPQNDKYEWEVDSTTSVGFDSNQAYQAYPDNSAMAVSSATSANNIASLPINSDESVENTQNTQNNDDEQISLDLRDDVVYGTYNGQVAPSSNNSPVFGSTPSTLASNTNTSTASSELNEFNDVDNGYAGFPNDSNTYDDSVIDKNLTDNSSSNNSGSTSGNNDNTNNANQGADANNANVNANVNVNANKDPINLEDDDQIENILPLSQRQSVGQRLVAKATPGGDVSKRVIAVVLFVGVGLLALWGGTDKKQNENTANNKSQVIKPVPIEKSNLTNTLNSPEIGQCPNPLEPVNEQVATATPSPTVVEPPPPVIIPAPPPAPPPIGSGDIEVPIIQPVRVEKASRQYAFQLRAGQQVIKSYEQQQIGLQAQQTLRKEDGSDSPKTRTIARGTTVPMMMIQPFRNDLPGVVKCQVIVDIKDSKGALLIPAGSIASVPFAPFRNNSRVFNRVDSPTTISLSDGREIELKGTVIDKKGFVGLEGKVRRSGDASFPKRVGRTMAKVLTFGAASAVGGAGGFAIAEAGNSTVDSTYFYTAATGSYVELPVGTMFVFNVSGN